MIDDSYDEIQSCLSKKGQINHMAAIIISCEQLMGLLSEEYMKDNEARNASIDALISILREYKIQEVK